MNDIMKTKNYLTVLLVLILSSVFFTPSCTEKIDIDLDSTYQRTVIYGQITTDTTSHKVTVTTTGDYYSNLPPQGISGANVRISDGENEFILLEDSEEEGAYYTDPNVYGVPGRNYTIFVENVDLLGDGNLKSYNASSELMPVASPDSIKAVYRENWEGWAVQAYAQDPPETEDFYMFLVYVNDELDSDSLQNIIITDDALFNGNYTNGVVVYYLNGVDALSVGDTITTAFCGISRDYYKYLTEAQVATRPSVPLFSGPPANPRSNFNNGAIGYFAAYSLSRASTIIEEEE
jgi:hypothetical protein